MTKSDLEQRIDAVEKLLKETDREIQKGFELSLLMTEPHKTLFVNDLKLNQVRLDGRRAMLEEFKADFGV